MTAAAAGRHRGARPAPWHRRLLDRLRAARQRRQVEAARDDAYVVRIEAHAVPPIARVRAVVQAYSNAIADAHGVPPAAVLPDEPVPGLEHLERPDWEFGTGTWRKYVDGLQ